MKMLLAPILVVIVGIGMFVTGYKIGSRQEQRRALEFHLVSYAQMYAVADHGDVDKMKRDLSILLFGTLQEYKRHRLKPSQAELQGVLDRVESIVSANSNNFVEFDPLKSKYDTNLGVGNKNR